MSTGTLLVSAPAELMKSIPAAPGLGTTLFVKARKARSWTENDMRSRNIIFGDVHGCISELSRLVDGLRVRDNDTLIFCGDLVDKGPSSAAVVRYIRGLARQGVSVVLVKGNHEEKHERFRKHEERIAGTDKENPIKGADEIREINRALTPEDIQFLESAVMYHKMPEQNALVVHAGIPPWMTKLPNFARLSKRQHQSASQILRLRYHDDYGNMVPLVDVNPSQHTFWADKYDGRFGRVFFGHEPFIGEEPKGFRHATGMDTGCVFGGSLTAAVFEDRARIPWFKSEPAAKKYSKAFGE